MCIAIRVAEGLDLAVQTWTGMGTQLNPATYATVAPFFETLEPLGTGESRCTELLALMDMIVDGERCRVWSAAVVSLEADGRVLGRALVMGPRFPGDAEPEMFDLTATATEGFAVQGSVWGWAGVIRE
jgi:hypothetical protein